MSVRFSYTVAPSGDIVFVANARDAVHVFECLEWAAKAYPAAHRQGRESVLTAVLQLQRAIAEAGIVLQARAAPLEQAWPVPAQPGPANALVKCANCTAPLNSREPLCGVCGFAPEKGQK